MHSDQIIDNLPAASIVETTGPEYITVETSYSKRFPVGYKVAAGPEFAMEGDGRGVKVDIDQRADYFLYNHVELIIK